MIIENDKGAGLMVNRERNVRCLGSASKQTVWRDSKSCILLFTLVTNLALTTVGVAEISPLSCERIIKEARETAVQPNVAIDPLWGVARITLNKTYCREPVEQWQQRSIDWPSEIAPNSERPKHLLSQVKKVADESANDGMVMSNLRPIQYDAAPARTASIEVIEGTKSHYKDQINNTEYSSSQDDLSEMLSKKDMALIAGMTPNLQMEVSNAIFPKTKHNHLIVMNNRVGAYNFNNQNMKLFAGILITFFIIVFMTFFRNKIFNNMN